MSKRTWWPPSNVEMVLIVMATIVVCIAVAWHLGYIPVDFGSPAAPPAASATPAQHTASSAHFAGVSKNAAAEAKSAADSSARNTSASAGFAQNASFSASAAQSAEKRIVKLTARSETAADRAEAAARTATAAAARAKADKKPARKSQESKSAAPAAQAGADRIPTTDRSYPASLASLQPLQRFAKGQGEGYAREYKQRSKGDFVALLRDPILAKSEMRVSCDVLVRQMMEANKDLPFEGCEGAAAAIERDADFAVIDCQDPTFLREYYLGVTNGEGSSFNVWHRRCLPNEKVLAYKGRPLVSLLCLNVAFSVSPVTRPLVPLQAATLPVRPMAPIAKSEACPDGWTLHTFAWSRLDMSAELREKIDAEIAKARNRNSEHARRLDVYFTDDVSRTYGRRLVMEVRTPAQVNATILVRLLDPITGVVVKDLGSFRMENGKGTFKFPQDPRPYVLETSWVGDFDSPPVSGDELRMRAYPNEMKDLCGFREHGITRK